METMEKPNTVEWRSRNGDTIIFGIAAPFLCEEFDPGTPIAEAETIKKIRHRGKKTYNVTAGELMPQMYGSMHGKDRAELDRLRKRLQAAMNPEHFGTLIYHTNDGSYKLRCRPVTGAKIESRVLLAYPFSVEWESDDPYWVDAKDQKLFVGERIPKWTFPWSIKPKTGTIFGVIKNRGIIRNPSEIEIEPHITISGTESNRVVIGNDTTGMRTTIDKTIADGDKLELDMSIPSIRLVHADGTSEDATHWTTIDSDFPWTCEPGENEIFCDVDNPALTPIIAVTWNIPEAGV